MTVSFFLYLNDSLKDFIYLFLERGMEGKKEEEKHQCVVASHTPTAQACALD